MGKILRRVICGAAAGAAGSLAMHGIAALWGALTDGRPEQGAFGLDEEANVNSVRKLFPRMNRADANRLGLAFHYAYGTTAGTAYALLAEKAPAMRAGFGTLFGLALWLVGDEAAITAAGVSDARLKTTGSHVTALAAHAAFGAIAELGARVGIVAAAVYGAPKLTSQSARR